MKLNNEARQKIAKAQNITSLIGKKIAAEVKSANNSKTKVNVNTLAENLANRREKALSEEG